MIETSMKLVDAVEAKFRQIFGEHPMLVRSPGRVNLIGEHTDYNMGYVLPAAIEKAIYFAIAPGKGRDCRIVSLDLDGEHRFSLEGIRRDPRGWPNYLMGVADQFTRERFPLGGFNCVFGGDIPIGAGLSSSAAIEAGLAFALNRIFDCRLDGLALARLAQKAENEFVGVKCGIMDQYINLFGQPANALLVDCRTLRHECYPVPEEISIVLFDTGVSHSLASSEYNRRREECALGVESLRRKFPEVTHLRDVSPEMLEECRDGMDATVFRRCGFVVAENARVLQACEALEANDAAAFGSLLYGSHGGLRDDYEVSCPELDVLVEAVRGLPGVYGARMMGGGFGGCTINLTGREEAASIGKTVREAYRKRFNAEPKMYATTIGTGTRLLNGEDDARD